MSNRMKISKETSKTYIYRLIDNHCTYKYKASLTTTTRTTITAITKQKNEKG